MMLNTTSDQITCDLVEQSDNYHFLMHCEDCDAAVLARRSLADIESWYQQGMITQVEFEAYVYVWATFSPHGAKPEWAITPFDNDVLRVARKIASLIGEDL